MPIGSSLLPLGLDSPLQFLLLGSLAMLLIGTAKAGFGGSIGLLATPLMIYACGGRVQLALGLMLPLLIVADHVALFKWWGRWDWRIIGLLLPGAVAGIAIGGLAFVQFRQLEATGHRPQVDGWLKLAVGLIALAFVALQAWRALRKQPPAFRPVLWQGTVFGATAGFTSTLAHAAGPVTAMYLLPQGLPKETYVASTALYYWINNLLKVPVYLMFSLNVEAARGSILLLPAVIAGTLLGVLLCRRIGQRHFNLIVYALLALAGVQLLHDALRVLLP